MGRLRTHANRGFPPQFFLKRGRYYFGRNNIALGADLKLALAKYAALYVPKPIKPKSAKVPRHEMCLTCGRVDDAEARYRESSRGIANMAVRRGKLIRQPCEKCGAAIAEKHHDSYKRPLDVRWLCRMCHVEHHRTMNDTAQHSELRT